MKLDAEATKLFADKQGKVQSHRLGMTLLSAANISLQSAIIALYAWAGEVPWSAALLYFAVQGGSTAFYAVLIQRGWNLRLKDQGLLLPQLVTAVVVQLAFMVLMPKLWVVFLVGVLVTYNFAMMSFSSRQFTRAWLLVCAAIAVALFAVRGRFDHLGTSDLSIAILWLFFVVCFRQLTAIGTQFSSLRTKLSEQNKQLSESLERIQLLASHDDLTGILNRRAFMQLLADERTRALRVAQPFCVALFDIDHFKAVNDRFGHLVGDAVLKEFCSVAAAALRGTDRFARYGGEEFILLLAPATTSDQARIGTERVRQAVEAHDWERIAAGLKLTMSSGIAMFNPDESIEQLVGRADRALYAAKDSGRNRTAVA